ncbi:hypothetical protein [Bradyrhizobium sp. 33ap4]|uniref:hypothetical protein n=1 Tax=Bradyrhizobium sp. 33ap4 TaxID=3061630 RepID=UPI002931579E|nr:hypothetical protein [Bradyrhizobium sp. 33ap4]
MKPIAGRPEAVPHAFHRNSHTAPGFVPGFRLSNEREFIVQDMGAALADAGACIGRFCLLVDACRWFWRRGRCDLGQSNPRQVTNDLLEEFIAQVTP